LARNVERIYRDSIDSIPTLVFSLCIRYPRLYIKPQKYIYSRSLTHNRS